MKMTTTNKFEERLKNFKYYVSLLNLDKLFKELDEYSKFERKYSNLFYDNEDFYYLIDEYIAIIRNEIDVKTNNDNYRG